MNEHADDLNLRITAIREEVVNSTLTIVTLASTVLYAGNMARNLSIGTGLSFLHTGLFLSLIGVFVFRRRIGARVISWLIATLLYVASTGGLFVYGLAGNSAVVFMGFCFVVTTFFGIRGGIVALLLSVATMSIGALLMVGGQLKMAVDPATFLLSPYSWISSILTISSIGGVILLQLSRLNARQFQLLHDQHFLARHDPLTGLANRMALEAIIELAIAESRRGPETAAIMLIDLDRFKTINDSLGHQVGDQMLIEVARRLQQCVRGGDTVARLGGDEFVIVLRKMTALEPNIVADRILKSLSAPYTLVAGLFHTTPSIGISISPQDSDDVGTLLRFADTAMYEAKAKGGAQFQYFAPGMNEAATKRLNIESQLRSAIANNEFRIAYQAKVNMTGTLTGFEALIRWQAANGDLLSPAIFIPIAEESDLINEIGHWMIDNVCRQLKLWQDAGLNPVPVAVNLSPRQLRQTALIEKIRSTVEHCEISTSLLELEITEGAAMENPEHSTRMLGELSAMGIQLSIDDFGTGFSSLSRLSGLPVSTLKIDRSFVMNLETDESARSIAISTIGLAHGLAMKVVAEGVETHAQWSILEKYGCDEMQGYLFSKPSPHTVAEGLLSNRLVIPASS